MVSRFKRAKQRAQAGFTLIELLVVITILGILAAIVVFSVSGVTDRGQTAACKTDTTTIRTGMEAYYAKNNTYPTTGAAPGSVGAAVLVPNFLSTSSTLHDVVTSGTGSTATYVINETTPSGGGANPCGTAGSPVGGSNL